MKFIKSFGELSKDDVLIAGGKGASLGEMTRAGFKVPHGFVVLTDVFDNFLEQASLNVEIDSILHSVNTKDIRTIENASGRIKSLILNSVISEDIASEILASFDGLGVRYVAVRSSATSEDGFSAAWAGQLESYLNIYRENLLEGIKKCWASLFTPRAIFYRLEKNLHGNAISVAVVVQKMVQSESAGVVFSVHPITQDWNQLVIEAGRGLGEALVAGKITPDNYVVEKEPRRIINKNSSDKEQILTDGQILELSEIALRIENHYGFPCDIEWALENGEFYIVQSRPITTLNNQSASEVDLSHREMILIASRETNLFESSLRIRSWSEGLIKELGIGYKSIVINSDGEYYVDSKSEDMIRKSLEYKNFNNALEYIKRMYELRCNLLKGVTAENYTNLNQGFSDLFTYFFIARRITENVYSRSNAQEKKLIENWRNDETLFEPLDIFYRDNPEKDLRENWSAVFNNGQFIILSKKLSFHSRVRLKPTIKEIYGNTAYPGKVKGSVCLVMNRKDLDRVKSEDILVTTMTHPNYTILLGKVAAIVTDEGGITSHAAIVARELKKPCVIGTKVATQILKNGDIVEVDADRGIVKIIN